MESPRRDSGLFQPLNVLPEAYRSLYSFRHLPPQRYPSLSVLELLDSFFQGVISVLDSLVSVVESESCQELSSSNEYNSCQGVSPESSLRESEERQSRSEQVVEFIRRF